MVFSSNIFLLYFFPLVLIAYYLVPKNFRNLLIVIVSLAFYTWGAPKYVFIVLFSLFADFFFAKYIHKTEGRNKKIILAIALSVNIGLLAYFKYANFFVENFNELLQSFGMTSVHWAAVALPIGISFFTFHEMSYLIDVYRNEKPPFKSIVDYGLYILFFPQLIAGPIIRFHEISDQILNRDYQENFDNRLIGFFRFCIGLAKKVLIANVMGETADQIFALSPEELTTSLSWIGILAYTFQIYFDFSGYSDMAIGIARMMGFIFPENFNNPYISQSITEFWRRWHMTLSRWMRDYLYIPLGGNRVSKSRMYFNLVFVFLISGLWHGAAWNFVFWGAFHGLFLLLDRLFLLKVLKKIGKLPSIVLTFFITMIGWVFFRSENLALAWRYLGKMFSLDRGYSDVIISTKFLPILFIAILFSFWGLIKGNEQWQIKVFQPYHNIKGFLVFTCISLTLLVICVGSITTTNFNPFIYFRF
ncbi:MAG: MBOAT family protein [Lentimicrobiaceae bacterium]|nr:MBOAT family protein [Lentimicrobiaceae bacterium]